MTNEQVPMSDALFSFALPRRGTGDLLGRGYFLNERVCCLVQIGDCLNCVCCWCQ
jgi:hypothetical protein